MAQRRKEIGVFGRRFYPDPRDKKHALARIHSDRLSCSWNDSWWSGDQGGNPACVGFAWAHWLACQPIRQYVDPYGIYGIARYMDEWPGTDHEGTTIRAGAKMLSALGFIGEYRWAWDLDRVVEAILELGPVVIGTNWHLGMDEPDDAGYLNLAGPIVGSHATLLSGVDRRRKRFRLKNSWGPAWGTHGHVWLRFGDFDALLAADGEACLALEKKPSPYAK